MLKLMYVTNNPDVAIIAQRAGIDRIWIDLETKGKEERQKNLNTLKSHHSLDDIKKIKPILSASELLVRVNPLDDESENEINTAITNGADIIMLPMWKTPDEVKKFISIVNSRCKTMLLLETKEAAECVEEVLNIQGIDEIHIGINDLSLSYKKTFMFEVVANGLVADIINKIKSHNIPCGFGGITKLSAGLIPAEIVITEHYRVGSSMAILAKSFCNVESFQGRMSDLEDYFQKNISDIRKFEKNVQTFSKKYFENNRQKLCFLVKEMVGKIHE